MTSQIGNLLKDIRKKTKLTKVELAKITKLSPRTIYKIEHDKGKVSVEVLAKIRDTIKENFGINLFEKTQIKIVWELKDLDKEALDIVEGNLLGDGCISMKIKSEKGFYCQGAKDRVYLEWLGRTLSKKGIISRVHSVVHHHSYSRESKQYYGLYTHSCPAFFELRRKWYKYNEDENKFIKTIPLNIKLNSTILLHWYLGDGDLKRDRRNKKGGRPCARISTNAFSLSEMEFLIERLKQDLGLNSYASSMHRREGRDYVLYLLAGDCWNFFKIVGERPPEEIKNCITKVVKNGKIYRFVNKWPDENDWVKILPKTENIGKVLRERRKALNFTQRELAEKVGVKKHHISQIENGRKYTSLPRFNKFLETLNLDVQTINRRLLIET